jgi:hypothetical protein
VNVIGQQVLKNHLHIHLYGSPEKLHPNIRNNLTNLCKHVRVHKEDELLVPIARDRKHNADDEPCQRMYDSHKRIMQEFLLGIVFFSIFLSLNELLPYQGSEAVSCCEERTTAPVMQMLECI